MDGMKLQPCNPGFVDGRDAILQADLIANGGINRDRIWEVFASRGLGLSASSGDVDNRFDQIQAFDTPAPLSITDNTNDNFKIFPNPSNGIFSITSVRSIENGVISVYDFNGRLVHTNNTNFNTVERLNLSSLKSGIYLVSIKGEELDFVSKIVIE